MQPTRRLRAGSPWDVFLFGLAPDGVYHALYVTITGGELLPRHFTLAGKPGGIFSVALSTGRPVFALRTILPCGVRTFLSGLLTGATMHPLLLLYSDFLAILKEECTQLQGIICQEFSVIRDRDLQLSATR